MVTKGSIEQTQAMNTTKLERLRAFRHHWYHSMQCRRDAQFEIMDAVLSASVIESPAHLSVTAGLQRKWGSISDALNQGNALSYT